MNPGKGKSSSLRGGLLKIACVLLVLDLYLLAAIKSYNFYSDQAWCFRKAILLILVKSKSEEKRKPSTCPVLREIFALGHPGVILILPVDHNGFIAVKLRLEPLSTTHVR